MNARTAWLGSLALAATPVMAQAPVPVTIDNFVRAESDMYMGGLLKESGQLGKLSHRREVAAIDNQTVIRLNRDTLYSSAVFDLDAGPATITLPDAGGRFMSMMVVSEDHYVPAVYYDAGPHEITRELVGTRYAVVGIRTLVDPDEPEDLRKVHALQDAITVRQAGAGSFEVPNCAMRCWCSRPPRRASRARSAGKAKSTRSSDCWAPLPAGAATRTRTRPT